MRKHTKQYPLIVFVGAVILGLPLVLIVFNNGYLGNVRQWQELYFNKRYSSTRLMYHEPGDDENWKYTPDFVRLAESYNAAGIRVTEESQIKEALDLADSRKNGPTLIEVIIDPESNVWPMVPAGNTLDDMIMYC